MFPLVQTRKENVQPGSLHLLILSLHTSGLDLFTSFQTALPSSLFGGLIFRNCSLESIGCKSMMLIS
ncbi:MAG: hypothetical protein CBD11_01425 [Phycisphaera sp. TMED151]|nr:MAG: hypothetical protein CBD11_01425 [Phycisphaera sp. TMED151]